jgi:hypothetical protein
MPNLHDLINTYLSDAFGVGFAAFFLGAVAACLAPLLLVEGTVLLGMSHLRLRPWGWRPWMAIVLLLTGVGNLVLATKFHMLYTFVQTHDHFICRVHPCGPLLPDPATARVLTAIDSLATPSVLWLLATYALALVGLVMLGAGRRRQHRPEAAAVR